jgi:hypothetical protein
MAAVGLILAVAFFVFFWIIIPLFFGMPGLRFGGGGGFPSTAPMIQFQRKTKWKYAVYPGGSSADIPSACIRSSDGSVMLFNTDDEARVMALRLSQPEKKFYVHPVAVGRRWGIK